MLLNVQIALKIHQKTLVVGASPGRHWGSSQRSQTPYTYSGALPQTPQRRYPKPPLPAGELPTFLKRYS
jgi:hypothetical protein